MPEADDVTWVFAIDDQLSRQTSRRVDLMIQTLAVCALSVAVFPWAGLSGLLIVLCLSVLAYKISHVYGDRTSRQRLHITPLGICLADKGQPSLRLLRLQRHPAWVALLLAPVGVAGLGRFFRVTLWRHHFEGTTYRRLMLVLDWLALQEVNHE